MSNKQSFSTNKQSFSASKQSFSTSKVFIDHWVAEAWGIDPKLLNSKTKLSQAALNSAKDLKLTVMKSFIHKFKPHGLSLILVISESHLAVHTWPELGYINVDVISCSKSADLSKLKEVLRKQFKPSQISTKKVKY